MDGLVCAKAARQYADGRTDSRVGSQTDGWPGSKMAYSQSHGHIGGLDGGLAGRQPCG